MNCIIQAILIHSRQKTRCVVAWYTPRGYHVAMKATIKKQVLNRIRRIEGQVRGLQKMVEDEKYCVDIITQTSAVRKALSAVEDSVLENHLSTHVADQMKSGNVKKATKEMLLVYKVFKKK